MSGLVGEVGKLAQSWKDQGPWVLSSNICGHLFNAKFMLQSILLIVEVLILYMR